MREPDLERIVSDAIAKTPAGKKVEIRFPHIAASVVVKMKFAGGWTVEYTLVPGMSIQFIRGEDGYLNELGITVLDDDGLKPHV
ncbi:MAG: hypothetical protein ACOY5W_09075 [Pseudomonadota bacterium]